MKHFLSLFLIILISFTPLTTYANKIMVVKKGEIVQFDGYLVDSPALIKLKNGKKHAEETCKLEIGHTKNLLSSQRDHDVKICEIKLKSREEMLTKLLNIKNQEIKEMRDTIIKGGPRTNLTPLWITIAFVAGATTAIGIAFALKPVFEQKN